MQFLGIFALLAYALFGAIRPGVNYTIKDQPPARSAPTDTGVWFVCGTSDQGPTFPVLVRSIADFVNTFGARATYSYLYDSLDAFFREGGGSAYVSRVVGPGAVLATKNLLDSGAGVSLTVNALGPGTYGNALKVGVVAGTGGGTFQIQVTDTGGTVLEQSGDLATQAEAVGWGMNSQYIRVVLGATALNPAVVAPAALAGGTDDRASITDAQWQAALDRFTVAYGPGQVSYPGRTTDTAHVQLTTHAAAYNRVALLDAPDTSVVATLTTSATNARSRVAAMFAPWAVVPGLTPGTTRTIPMSAIIAGMIARSDVTNGPNAPVAGDNGQSVYAVGLSQPAWTDTNRQTLNTGGVNVSVIKYGGVRNYGYRSLANPTTDPYWLDFGNARLIMDIVNQAEAILEQFLFQEIDGQGRLFSRVDGALSGLLQGYYTSGDIYGATPQEAYNVVCDDSNNTPTTIANHELHATIAFRASEFAELVQLDIVKVPVNQTIA